jgi:AcrR family transcriptional regulator
MDETSVTRTIRETTVTLKTVARQANPELREAVLAKVLDFVYEHGLAELSLRRCGESIGVSARMLVYYFGTKEALVAEAIRAGRPAVADLFADIESPSELREALSTAYRHFTGEPNRRPAVLLLQVMALALTDPQQFETFAAEAITAWVDPLAAAFARLGYDAPAARSTVLISGMRGVALDAFLTGNPDRARDAATVALAALVPDL